MKGSPTQPQKTAPPPPPTVEGPPAEVPRAIPMVVFTALSWFLCARYTSSLTDHSMFDAVLGPNIAICAAAATYWLWSHAGIREWERAAATGGALRGMAVASLTAVCGWFLSATVVYIRAVGMGLGVSLGHIYLQFARAFVYHFGLNATTLGGLLLFGVIGYVLDRRDRN